MAISQLPDFNNSAARRIAVRPVAQAVIGARIGPPVPYLEAINDAPADGAATAQPSF